MKMNDNASTILNPTKILTVQKLNIEFRKIKKEHLFKDHEYELDFMSYRLMVHYPTRAVDLNYKTDEERQVDYDRLEAAMKKEV
jgi:hypothetical protein